MMLKKRHVAALFGALVLVGSLASAQFSGVRPNGLADKSWKANAATFSALPLSRNTAGDKVWVDDTRTLWEWTCSIVGSSQVCLWQQGATGAPGADGKTIRSGSGAPGSGLGALGDFYIDVAGPTLYGPKSGGGWGSGTPLSITGPPGAPGNPGTNGQAATVAVGTVTTGSAGSSASVSNAGTSTDATFNFTIPRGDKGDPGDPGANGTIGAAGADGDVGPAGPAPSGAANLILATPNGSSGTSALRPMVAADLPAIFNAPTSSAWDHTPSPCGSGNLFVTGISAAGVLTCGSAPINRGRIVLVDSTLSVADLTVPVYPDIPAAAAFVAAQSPTTQGSWSIVLTAGAANNSGNSSNNYPFTTLTVPPSTEIRGLASGFAIPNGFEALPILAPACTSGTCITLQGGSSLSNLFINWRQAPTAAVKLIENNNSGSTYKGSATISNVSVLAIANNNTFPVDVVTNTAGLLYTDRLNIQASGNALGRLLVNTSATAGDGVTTYNGRLIGSTNGVACIENAGVGAINPYFMRIDPAKCVVDLKNSSTGTINPFATQYSATSGTITPIATHMAFGGTLPGTCSAGQEFELTVVTGGETPCLCAAAGNAWNCVGRDIPRSAPPYVCSSSTVGGHYYDLEDNEMCDCKGLVPAWVSRGAGTCS